MAAKYREYCNYLAMVGNTVNITPYSGIALTVSPDRE